MRSLGYNVEAFPSAANFLASPRLIETTCLVADVHMPAMTGVELYKHLIEAGYTIPTILVTAYPDDVERARALNDGVVCYLRKPVDEQHLIRCLRRLSSLVSRAKRIREFLLRAGQGEPKYGPAGCIHVCPQPAPVGIDDRPTDRQSHPYSAGLRGVEGIKNAIEMFWINPRSGIAHCYEDATRLVLLCGDR